MQSLRGAVVSSLVEGTARGGHRLTAGIRSVVKEPYMGVCEIVGGNV